MAECRDPFNPWTFKGNVFHTSKADRRTTVQARIHQKEFGVMIAWPRAAVVVPDAACVWIRVRIEVASAAQYRETRMTVRPLAFGPLVDVARHVIAAEGAPSKLTPTDRQRSVAR